MKCARRRILYADWMEVTREGFSEERIQSAGTQKSDTGSRNLCLTLILFLAGALILGDTFQRNDAGAGSSRSRNLPRCCWKAFSI